MRYLSRKVGSVGGGGGFPDGSTGGPGGPGGGGGFPDGSTGAGVGVAPTIDFALSIPELNADVILAMNPVAGGVPLESDIPMTRMDLNDILTNERLQCVF